MITVMVTWLTTELIFVVIMLIVAADLAARKGDKRTAMAGGILMVAFTTPPMIYVVGWLLLPAWGIGAIPFGGR